MEIRRGTFSKETREVLEKYADHTYIFDFKADSSVRSAFLQVWTCENGEWIEGGGMSVSVSHSAQRIAVCPEDNSIILYPENGKGSVPCDNRLQDAQAVYTSLLDNPTEIVLEKEIPLYVYLGYNDQSILHSNLMEGFKNAGCDKGTAVTITFSEQEDKGFDSTETDA